jgi:hypothetical protein
VVRLEDALEEDEEEDEDEDEDKDGKSVARLKFASFVL